MKGNNLAIPVIMYHTVGRIIPDWKWSFLTVSAKVFEDHLRWLVKTGYQTVDLDELYRHVAGEQLLPPRSVVLTFDDGYLDNWTYVAPLLRKYGCKGTVFVNPDFVDPRETLRPTLEDVWAGKASEDKLPIRGFMSWPELRYLTEHGPLCIEAHAMTHTWYPTGPKIVDFHHPDDGYYWLNWNSFPETKPFYLKVPQKSAILLGTPIYEHQKSLAARKYFPDPAEEKVLSDFVRGQGGRIFFKDQRWREKLQDKVRKIHQSGIPLGRYETEEEQIVRYRFELAECKNILSGKLGRKIEFMCWPGGGYNEISRSLALEYYKAVTLGSADLSPICNRPNDNPRLIRRFGVPWISCKEQMVYPGGRYLVQVLREYQGSLLARRYRQMLKVMILSGLEITRFVRRVNSGYNSG